MGLRASRHPLASLGLVAGLLVTLLMACQPSPPSALAKDQTLRMMWSNATGAPDPVQAAGTPAMVQLTNLLYDSLVTLNRNDQIEPWGASSWTISPDGLTYTFTLRPNQRFSDGAPVRASDYAWSINRALSPCLPSGFTDYFSPIKDAATLSGEICNFREAQGAIQTLVSDSIIPNDITNTLTIILARPAGYFLAQLASTPFFVLEQSVVLADIPGDVQSDNLGGDGAWTRLMSDGKTGQGGSGMFYLASRVVDDADNVTLLLKQNPYWWGRHAGKTPHFTTITLESPLRWLSTDFSQFADNPSVAFLDANAARNLPPLATFQTQPDYHVARYMETTMMLLNETMAPFDDLNARKAFCLAVNRDQINQQVFQGAMIPTWRLVPAGMPGYQNGPHGLENAPVGGNMALARDYWRRYLAAHPSAKAPGAMAVNYFQDNQQQQLVAALQANFATMLGSQLTLKPPPHPGVSVPYNQLVKWTPLTIYNWNVDYADPQDFLTLLFENSSPFAPLLHNSGVPAADTLMRQADALGDMRQRIPLYQQAEQLLIDNVVVCPLYQTMNRYALRIWVRGGFVEDGRGVFPNDAWVSGYIAKH